MLFTFFYPATKSLGLAIVSYDSERTCEGCSLNLGLGDPPRWEWKFLLARNLLCGELIKLSPGRGLWTAGKDILTWLDFKTGDALTKLENLGAGKPVFRSSIFLASLSFCDYVCWSSMRCKWSSWASRYFFIEFKLRRLSVTSAVKIVCVWSAGLTKFVSVGSFITFDVFSFLNFGILFVEESSSVRDLYY